MIGLLISLVILLVVCAVVYWLIQYLGLPPIVQKVAVVVMVLFALIWLLSAVGFIGWGQPVAVR